MPFPEARARLRSAHDAGPPTARTSSTGRSSPDSHVLLICFWQARKMLATPARLVGRRHVVTSQTYEVDTRKLRARPRLAPTHRARAESPCRSCVTDLLLDCRKPADAACHSDRNDAVLDGEVDQLCAALQLE